MFDILKKTVITDNVIEYVLSAPKIAAKARPERNGKVRRFQKKQMDIETH